MPNLPSAGHSSNDGLNPLARSFGRHAKLLAMVALAFAAGCAEPEASSSDTEAAADPAPLDTVAIRAAIDSLRADYEAAVASGDLASLGALVTDDVIAVGPGGAQWDSLRAASEFPWPPGATLDISPIEVRVLNSEWAYELGSSTATYTPPGASERRTLQDTYMVLFRRTPTGWKLHREVASPALLPGQ